MIADVPVAPTAAVLPIQPLPRRVPGLRRLRTRIGQTWRNRDRNAHPARFRENPVGPR